MGPLHLLAYRPAALCAAAGPDSSDATSSQRPSEDFAAGLLPLDQLASKPLAGRRLAVIQETTGEGVDAGKCAACAVLPLQAAPGSEPWLGPAARKLGGWQCVAAGTHHKLLGAPPGAGVAGALAAAVSHLQSLGAEVDQVRMGWQWPLARSAVAECCRQQTHCSCAKAHSPTTRLCRCLCPRLRQVCPLTMSLLCLRRRATCPATTACGTAIALKQMVSLTCCDALPGALLVRKGNRRAAN